MIRAPSVLCPVDFSENSRGALRYAAAIASHLGARLTLLAVNDPLLVEATQLAAGPDHLVEDTIRHVETFCRHTLAASTVRMRRFVVVRRYGNVRQAWRNEWHAAARARCACGRGKAEIVGVAWSCEPG